MSLGFETLKSLLSLVIDLRFSQSFLLYETGHQSPCSLDTVWRLIPSTKLTILGGTFPLSFI